MFYIIFKNKTLQKIKFSYLAIRAESRVKFKKDNYSYFVNLEKIYIKVGDNAEIKESF